MDSNPLDDINPDIISGAMDAVNQSASDSSSSSENNDVQATASPASNQPSDIEPSQSSNSSIGGLNVGDYVDNPNQVTTNSGSAVDPNKLEQELNKQGVDGTQSSVSSSASASSSMNSTSSRASNIISYMQSREPAMKSQSVFESSWNSQVEDYRAYNYAVNSGLDTDQMMMANRALNNAKKGTYYLEHPESMPKNDDKQKQGLKILDKLQAIFADDSHVTTFSDFCEYLKMYSEQPQLVAKFLGGLKVKAKQANQNANAGNQ